MLEGFTGELHVYDLLAYSSNVYATADIRYHLSSMQINIAMST